ncbi:hypothetical protein B0H14DRAFT_2663162 [Mycena olivaceomarginata]|nr:hypothetical protein B0H14DRAFT_2663162 [Mycena olivaceomarginata]
MTVSQTIAFLSAIVAFANAVPSVVYHDSQSPFQEHIRVPVELGVMSRCPDALLCESVFDQVVKQVGPQKVDLSLIYVATLNSSDTEFGITCMHGPGECAGNVQQLCVAKYASPSAWWKFVQCQNSHGRYQVGIPDLTLQCARTANIDWEGSGVASCVGLDVSGKAEEGKELLRQSALLGKSLGIEKSCTVLINRKKVCVHDGTWQECDGGHDVEDFVQRINSEYENLNAGRD